MQHLQSNTLLQAGKYKIIRHINSGGFGNTYEALDVNLNKRVAIKEFFVKDFCARESATTQMTITAPAKRPLIMHLKQKFIDEARAIAQMDHSNIVRVQALFEENNTAYYVMDYIEGQSLNDLLKQRGSLPEQEALPIIRKVADALDYMHSQNRFHLDIKPGNIMLRKDGAVILIDFGSSKQYAEVDGENTVTMAPCYTSGYAPVEQMSQEPTTFTAVTDIYALGATLYKCLTGQRPPEAIKLMQRGLSLKPLQSAGVSKKTIAAIGAAMQSRMNNRPQTVKTFIAMLNELKDLKEDMKSINSSNIGSSSNRQNISAQAYKNSNDNDKTRYRPGSHKQGQENTSKANIQNSKLWIVISIALAIILFLVIMHQRSSEKEISTNMLDEAALEETISDALKAESSVVNSISTKEETETAQPSNDNSKVISDNDVSTTSNATTTSNVYVVTKNMFVREGPGTSYETKYSPYCDIMSNNTYGTVVFKGSRVEVISSVNNDFVKVRQLSPDNDRDNWGEGWVSYKYLEKY